METGLKIYKYNFLLAILLSSITLTSCGSGTSTDVPSELQGNSEVVEYFEVLDEVIKEYISLMEEMSEVTKNQGDSEVNDFETSMNILSAAATSTTKLAPLMERLNELEAKGEVLKEDLSPEELEAFVNSYMKMILRLQEASSKMTN